MSRDVICDNSKQMNADVVCECMVSVNDQFATYEINNAMHELN